jgi:hypothetical protein
VATLDLIQMAINKASDEIIDLQDKLGSLTNLESPALKKREQRILDLTRYQADHISRLERTKEKVSRNPSESILSLEAKRTEKADRAITRLKLASYKLATLECSRANMADRLEARLARIEEVVLPGLLQLAEELVVRDALFVAASRRLETASTTLIKEKDIGVVDAALQKPKIEQKELRFEPPETYPKAI